MHHSPSFQVAPLFEARKPTKERAFARKIALWENAPFGAFPIHVRFDDSIYIIRKGKDKHIFA